MASITTDSITDLNMENKTSTFDQLYSYALVWLCSENTLKTLSLDRFKNLKIIKSTETFDIPFKCISHLSTVQNEKVILVVSNTLAENVIRIVHEMTNIYYIYLFTNNLEISSEKFIRDYPKVRGFYSDVDALIFKILLDTEKLAIKENKTTSFDDENSFKFTYKSTKSDSLTENSNLITNEFIAFQVFIDILLSSPDLTKKYGIVKAAQMCRHNYAENQAQLKTIDRFVEDYKSEDAIRWYTSPYFVGRELDKAFRRFDFEYLFAFQGFIVDLYTQLKEICLEHQEIFPDHIRTYSGRLLSANEFEYLKMNVGSLISLKAFFATTFDYAVASIYCGAGERRPQFESVIFVINTNMNMNYVRPFAYVADLTYCPDEKLVMFGLGFVFRIESLSFDAATNIWCAKLICSNEVQNEVEQLINQLKMDFDTSIDYITYGNVLNKLNRANETEKYYEVLLKMLSPSEKDMAQMFDSLATSYYLQGKYQLALEHYMKVLHSSEFRDNISDQSINELERETQYNEDTLLQPKLKQNMRFRRKTFCNIGRVYHSMRDYEAALRYLYRALAEELHEDSQSVNLIAIYNDIGSILSQTGRDTDALDTFRKALDIAAATLPLGHMFTGECLHNVGRTYARLGQYDFASEYFERALDMAVLTLPPKHPFIKQCLDIIASSTKRNSGIDDVTTATKHLQNLSTTSDEYHVPPS